jgi:hypothetical protein
MADKPGSAALLGINPAKVRHIITRARVFDAKEGVSDPDPGSNATDDAMADILEDFADDATYQELAEFIRSLDEEEQINLVALAWIGRGTYAAAEWTEALSEARAAHNARTAEYLTQLPMLGDYLEEGLAALEPNGDGVEIVQHKRTRWSRRPKQQH